LRFQHGPGTTANPVGAPLKNEHNILVALRRLGVMLSYNRFADQMLVAGLEGFGPELDDHAVVSLRLTIDRQFGFLPNKDYFYDVLANAALANSFHPIFDYFDTLSWDRQPRLDKWLTTYGGAKDTPYTNAAGRLMLLASVRRLRRPGCKFDEMLVLEGPQGTNKSSALKLLAVDDDWFLDDLPLGAASKDMIEQMTGKWIVEIADLHKKQKTDVNKIKAQLSRTEDRARLAYGRLAKSVRRSCVFFGTTNEDKYLEDPTGERRFWPIFTQRFDLEMLAHDRDQLWAEAVEMEARGESIRMDASLWTEAAIEQSQRSIVDPWYEHLDELLGEMNGKILNSDVWRLVGLTPDKMKRTDTLRIATVMRQLGFECGSLRFTISGQHGRKARGFVRGAAGSGREVQIFVRESVHDRRLSVHIGNSPEEAAAQEYQAAFLNGHDAEPF
jgi:predicted P-loop ATPase